MYLITLLIFHALFLITYCCNSKYFIIELEGHKSYSNLGLLFNNGTYSIDNCSGNWIDYDYIVHNSYDYVKLCKMKYCLELQCDISYVGGFDVIRDKYYITDIISVKYTYISN